jgi:hypothetical protein
MRAITLPSRAAALPNLAVARFFNAVATPVGVCAAAPVHRRGAAARSSRSSA